MEIIVGTVSVIEDSFCANDGLLFSSAISECASLENLHVGRIGIHEESLGGVN